VIKSIICIVAIAMSGSAFARGGGGHSGGGHVARSSGSAHSVRGYVTKRGTYVAPHRATNPDSTKTNNWSHKGNVNPDTGKTGTKKD
jgi:hypothetical protein